MPGTEFEVAIAGSGIAGLSAALTCARLGRKTLLLTGDIIGGQLLSIAKVDGYPGFPEGIAGFELCPMTQEQAAAAGTEFAAAELVSLAPQDEGWRIATSAGEHYTARAVIVATGARLKELGLTGEARLRGKGVSHCASCDAPLLRGRTAGVVGGGDSAMQEALTLAEAGVRVLFLCRGERLSGQAAYRARVEAHPAIEMRCRVVVEEVLGEAKVEGVRLRDTATGVASEVQFAGLFVYVGLQANAGFLGGLIALDAEGRIVTDVAMRTELRGVCAAGAVRSGWLGRAAISAGEGAAAALAVERYLDKGEWRDAR